MRQRQAPTPTAANHCIAGRQLPARQSSADAFCAMPPLQKNRTLSVTEAGIAAPPAEISATELEGVKWIQFEVRAASGGGRHPGTVEFVARYQNQQQGRKS